MVANPNTDKHRILHLYYEPHFSGVSRHVLGLVENLNKEEFETWTLVSTSDQRIEDGFMRILERDRVIVVPPSRFFSLRGVLRAAKLMSRQRIRTLHIHNLQSLLWGYSATLRAPTVKIVYTPQVIEAGNSALTRMVHGLLRQLKSRIDGFVAVSDSQARLVRDLELCNPESLSVVYNRVSPEAFTSGQTGESDCGRIFHDKVLVCQVGRLVNQKNPLFLVKAAEIALNQYPDFVFLLIGEGPMGETLQKEIDRRGLSAGIVLTGFREDCAQFMKAADIITLTSRWEGLPYALLEALLYRKPVLATNATGNRDLVIDGETGYLVETEEELAKRLLELASSKRLRETMGLEGYHRFQSLFDPRIMANEMEQVYAEVASRRA